MSVEITTKKTVNIPIEIVYETIINVNEYSKILEYIEKSKIYNKQDQMMQAKMQIKHSIIAFEYTCDIFLKKNKEVYINGTNGPFSKMNSKWKLEKISNETTNIIHEIYFEVFPKYLEKPILLFIKKKINTTIKAFEDYITKNKI